MKHMLVAASWMAFSALSAAGQGAADTPEFEVASVKSADMQDLGLAGLIPGPVPEMLGFEGGPGSADPAGSTITA
jgi:hypothetical protein